MGQSNCAVESHPGDVVENGRGLTRRLLLVQLVLTLTQIYCECGRRSWTVSHPGLSRVSEREYSIERPAPCEISMIHNRCELV